MNEIQLTSFLGTGWSFPPTFNIDKKSIKMVDDDEDIAESIRILLNTIPGERIMRPEYGCNLRRLVFEKNDSNLLAELNHIISSALLNFEPRVNFIGLNVVQQNSLDGLLDIEIDYYIIITNTRHNMVFPFYLTEGTNI